MTRHGSHADALRFEATNLIAELSVRDTSPFLDLPDGAQCYIEIGVDLDCATADVKHAVEEFVRHGRRPKFGPPLHTLDGSPAPRIPGPAYIDPIADVVLEVVEVGDPCKLSGQTHDGDKVEAELSLPIDAARQLGGLLYQDVRLVLVPVAPVPEDRRVGAIRDWLAMNGVDMPDVILKALITAGLNPGRLP
jgi:hypothetical protein